MMFFFGGEIWRHSHSYNSQISYESNFLLHTNPWNMSRMAETTFLVENDHLWEEGSEFRFQAIPNGGES